MDRDRTSAALRLATLLGAAAATGCASLPPPQELDLGRMRLVVVDTPPRIDVNGLPGGKAVGAGVGAGTGSGAGVLVAGAICLAAGPLFPLCVLAVAPTGALVGAATGGVVGAVRTESTDAIALKTSVLRDHLAVAAYQRALADRLQEELRDAGAIQSARADAAAESATPDVAPWTLDIAVTEVGTEGKGTFALRLVSRIALRRGAARDPVWSVEKEVQSETELTTDAWTAAEGRPMQIVLDRCVRQAAHELVVDLTRPFDQARAAAHPRSRRSTSCNDVPAEVAASAGTS